MSTEVQPDRVIRFLGNNEITVLVSGNESENAFSVMELVVRPRGGATALHTDRWVEVFHVLKGDAAGGRAGVRALRYAALRPVA